MGFFSYLWKKMKPRTGNFGVKPSEPSYSGGDGSGPDQAIVVHASSHVSGVLAEYEYISSIHGERGKDWNLVSQQLDMRKKTPIDILHVQTNSGEKITYYFDISNFFGKN